MKRLIGICLILFAMDTQADLASAPGLVTSDETCMGSRSMGIGWSLFEGITFGSTIQDEHCVRRLDARQIHNMGFTTAAKELMCDDPKIADAFRRAGDSCVPRIKEKQKSNISNQFVGPFGH